MNLFGSGIIEVIKKHGFIEVRKTIVSITAKGNLFIGQLINEVPKCM